MIVLLSITTRYLSAKKKKACKLMIYQKQLMKNRIINLLILGTAIKLRKFY
jgi:hypothetical protein